jgi:uncharacterized protein
MRLSRWRSCTPWPRDVHIAPPLPPPRRWHGAGLASSALLAVTGKVTGISGIVHSLVTPRSHSMWTSWRTSYTAGLVAAGLVLALPAVASRLDAFGQPTTASPATLVTGGLLVGFGTRLGAGCTSGHGVCGLPRLSPRSLVAVSESAQGGGGGGGGRGGGEGGRNGVCAGRP